MEEFWQEISTDNPTVAHVVVIAVKLLVAAFVGALPGIQRELKGTPAGLRTHMLVAIGSAMFVIAGVESGADIDSTSRIIQGLAAGIGFVGAGAILKTEKTREVQGLTTAANIYLTAGLGVAAGLGRFWLALVGSVIAFLILAVIKRIEPDDPNSDRYNSPEKD